VWIFKFSWSEAIVAALLGKKIGMTQLFGEDGRIDRITVIEAGPCHVTAIRTQERDGYEAVQLAFGETKEKRLTKGELGHLKKADAPALRHLAEFRDEVGELKVGDTVGVDAFEKGQTVKVSGISKGKGFQGTVKRHNFSRGPVTHGSHNVRAPGSIGASATPSRVFKGIRGPGQMGNKRVTQRGLEVVDVIADKNLLLVKGSVPGPRGSTVEIRTDARHG
jgi:large subunit ribosomal protein L3